MTARPEMPRPLDVLQGVVRLVMALVGLAALAGGVVWLFDGGTERWIPYLGIAAAALVPGALLLVGWRRMHRAAGIRATTAARKLHRDMRHGGWRIEAGLVGTVLILASLGGVVGGGFVGVAAAQRMGWEEARATYVALGSTVPENCAAASCPAQHRLVRSSGVAVFVDAPAKSWPPDDRLPGAEVTVYLDPANPDEADSRGPIELGLSALLLLSVGVTLGGAAWTTLSDANAGPEPPPPHTFAG